MSDIARRYGKTFELCFVVFASLFVSRTSSAEPPSESRAQGSLSVGVPMDGRLRHGEVLPKRGRGYELSAAAQVRRARFGVHELVMMIKQAALDVARLHPGSVLTVGDLSSRTGGAIEHHGSHQNGRDVDFMFYLTNRAGRPITNRELVPIDPNGFSTAPPLKYRFDAARNWSLVEALLESEHAVVQWIFVSSAVERLLIDYAEGAGVSPRLIGMAGQVLRQPGGTPHVDHFHVRIYCPRGDRPDCRDVGPRWAWTR